MYERFTDRARKLMQVANQEARRHNHEYVGTEHLLLAILKSEGIAAMVLHNLKVDCEIIRKEALKLIQDGPEMITMGKMPQTPRAKKVIELAMEEARKLDHSYVGTEHILLGLLQEKEGVAFQVLDNLGVKYETTRGAILELISGVARDDGAGKPSAPATCVISSFPVHLRHVVELAALRLEHHGERLDVAKEQGRPLVSMLIDTRHVVGPDGKKGSLFSFGGPMSVEHAREVNSLMCRIIKERCKS